VGPFQLALRRSKRVGMGAAGSLVSGSATAASTVSLRLVLGMLLTGIVGAKADAAPMWISKNVATANLIVVVVLELFCLYNI